jgi:hypothetical protein
MYDHHILIPLSEGRDSDRFPLIGRSAEEEVEARWVKDFI